MPSLESRLSALEEVDDGFFLIRQCPACGQLVPNPEACAMPARCELGQGHNPVPAPGPRDIVIQRSYGLGPRSESP